MTDTPPPRYVEVVSLADDRKQIVVPKANERQWADAPEPGTYLDPFDGKLRLCRWNRPRRRRQVPLSPRVVVQFAPED